MACHLQSSVRNEPDLPSSSGEGSLEIYKDEGDGHLEGRVEQAEGDGEALLPKRRVAPAHLDVPERRQTGCRQSRPILPSMTRVTFQETQHLPPRPTSLLFPHQNHQNMTMPRGRASRAAGGHLSRQLLKS
jgi:hypothetical protein